jgi:hypothetical protein
VPPPWQYQLVGALGHPTVVELVGARHEAPWTHPERVVDAISGFIG